MIDGMSKSLSLTNTEDKERLLEDQNNLKELHKRLIISNLHNDLENYIKNNSHLFKEELIFRKEIIEDFIKFIKEN